MNRKSELVLLIFAALHQRITKSDDARDDSSGWKGDELNMSSIMLQHNLSWRTPQIAGVNSSLLTYTVMYRMKTYKKWENVPSCTNMSKTTCDFDGIEMLADSDYWLKVAAKSPGSSGNLYNSSILKFRPENNTILSPPMITLSYSENYIFVRPVTPRHSGNGELLSKHIPALSYQLKYWPGNSTDVTNMSTAELIDSEIPLKVQPGLRYCVTIRLRATNVGDPDSKPVQSKWSEPPVCVAPPEELKNYPVTKTDEDRERMIVYACAGIASVIILIGVSYVGYRSWKIWKYINKKQPLPSTLMTVLKESPSRTVNFKERTQGCQLHETVDDIFFTNRHPTSMVDDTFWSQAPSEAELPMVLEAAESEDVSESDEFSQNEADKEDICRSSSEGALLNLTTHRLVSDIKSERSHFSVDRTSASNSALTSTTFNPRSQVTNNMYWCFPDYHEETRAVRSKVLLRHAFYDKHGSILLELTHSALGNQIISPSQCANEAFLENPDHATTIRNSFNASYSSNPKRNIPDLLYKKYVNSPEI